jgi:hypothetical protein
MFEDTSTDCAICLESLVDSSDAAARVITLTCGHKWHYDCIVQQLQTAQPTSARRLLFTGCQCAKCGTICDHPDLRDLTRTTDDLRERVDRLLQEQLALDAPDLWKQATTAQDPQSRTAILNHARRKYAFYLCSHCREPYFGGTVECADQVQGDQPQDAQEQVAEERLCVACAPQSQVTCRNPLEHRGHLVWKCRYCCKPSTHLCYGNVHFCDDCHSRNSERVRTSTSRSVKPPPLSPIPCPGADCPYPKPQGGPLSTSTTRSSHHSNGPTSKSEQVYGCAWCQSTSSGSSRTGQFEIEPGSGNLLQNPSGQFQLQGWHQHNRRMSWVVETSDLLVNANTTTNFVSGYHPCVMEQVLDLFTVLTTTSTARFPTDCSLEVSARYMGRTDCPSVFCLKAKLLDAQRRPLRRSPEQATPILEAPPDYWERVRLVLPISPNTNARYLSVVVMGKDSRFWQGRFGSKVTDISVRLLGPPEQVAALLQPAYRSAASNSSQADDMGNPNNLPAPPPPQGGGDQVVARRGGLLETTGNAVELPPQQPTLVLLRDGILPIVCFLLLAWLLQG